MGFFNDLRSIKRGINGEMERDLCYVTEPAALIMKSDRGSTAELKRAVSRRTQHEATLNGAYVRGLYDSLNQDETGRTLLLVSNLAGMTVASDDWSDLLSLARHIDTNHWLVDELSNAGAS